MSTMNKSSRFACMTLTFLFLFSGLNIIAAEGRTQQTKKAVHWESKDGEIQVFLVQDRSRLPTGYRLFVIAKTHVEIIYHTGYNGRDHKKRELKPIRTVGLDVYEYEFEHGFSEASYWMAIELREYGTRINGMTRTFEGSINRIVSNQSFLMGYCHVPRETAHSFK